MSERPTFIPPALPDLTKYDPRANDGVHAIKKKRRMTSVYGMVDVLDAYRRQLVTANEVVEYLRWNENLSMYGAMEYVRKNPDYVIPVFSP